MKATLLITVVCLLLTSAVFAQGTSASTTTATTSSSSTPSKRTPVFRPTKDQIAQVQKILKDKKLYSGESTGKYNDETRTGIKSFQKENGLKETGTLNRATLEKFGVELTDAQKLIPVSPNSFATSDENKPTAKTTEKPSTDNSSKRMIFRATGDQIKAAQKMLKDKSMYTGDESGKLDDATREGLKKYQEANGLKVTGTLNQATLEKMGIELTDKQKADIAATPATTTTPK